MWWHALSPGFLLLRQVVLIIVVAWREKGLNIFQDGVRLPPPSSQQPS